MPLSELDFIHLDINKKQGKLRQTLRQEAANANSANVNWQLEDRDSLAEAYPALFI